MFLENIEEKGEIAHLFPQCFLRNQHLKIYRVQAFENIAENGVSDQHLFSPFYYVVFYLSFIEITIFSCI